MGRVRTSVIHPAVRWSTPVIVAALSIAILSMRMCNDVTLPPKVPPPALGGEVRDVLKTSSASAASWRAGIERDARTLGIATPSDVDMTRALSHRLDTTPHVIAPGEGSIKAAGLELTAIAVDEEGAPRKALVLVIENLTDADLAYHVVTTPRPGGAACNQRQILVHDAIVVGRGKKVQRSECIYRSGMSLAIDRIETVALPPLMSAYVSRLPPAAVGADTRLSRGHRPELPAGMAVCSNAASQSLRADIENGTIAWRDLVDFYARHSCDQYQFPEEYKAFGRDGARALPAMP